MARRHIQGRDVDTEAFASNLREIADGIEDGSIGVDSITKRETANADDLTEFGLTLDFVATHDVSHAVTSLPYVGVDPDE